MNSPSSILHLRSIVRVFLLWLLLPGASQAQFTYITKNGTITITGYTGPGGAVAIPDTINGLPVTEIGKGAFHHCWTLTEVTIPESVTEIAWSAFEDCHSGLSRGWVSFLRTLGAWMKTPGSDGRRIPIPASGPQSGMLPIHVDHPSSYLHHFDAEPAPYPEKGDRHET